MRSESHPAVNMKGIQAKNLQTWMPEDKVLHSYLGQRSDFQSRRLLFLLKVMQSIRTHLSDSSGPLRLGI